MTDARFWRGLGLLRDDAEENAMLESIPVPILERGTQVMAIVIAAWGIWGTLTVTDGDDRINVSVLVVTVAPWLVTIVIRRRPMAPAVVYAFASVVLAPFWLLVLAEPFDWGGGEDGAIVQNSVAASCAVFLVLLMMGETIVAPRRQATIVNAAACVTVVVVTLVSGDPFGFVIWGIALTFVLASHAATRAGALALARARDALAASKAAEERRQIARDVHDVVAHTLAVTMLHLTAARMSASRAGCDDVVETLEEAERHGRTSLGDIRRIIRMLRSNDETPVDAAQPDLADIDELVERYRLAGLDLELSLHGPTDRITPGAGLAVYRVVQEALANAARHGRGAGSTTVKLQVDDGEVAVEVRNPAATPPRASSTGSGLVGMEERVAAVGGTVQVGPQNGQWVVDVRIPVEAKSFKV